MNIIAATSLDGKIMRNIRKSSLDCFAILKHNMYHSSPVNGLNGLDAERDLTTLLPGVFVQHLTIPSNISINLLRAEY